jgi:excinuclease ABC subunit B
LVAILDADKEGFLRNQRSLIQTIGRAARNVNGLVIMYADKITDSMAKAIEETDRRREKQIEYNLEHGWTPRSLVKSKEEIMRQTQVAGKKFGDRSKEYIEPDEISMAAEAKVNYKSKADVQKLIDRTRKQMETAAKDLDFMEAAKLRDELFELQKLLNDFK